MSIREAQQSGRPCGKNAVKELGSRCIPEALLYTNGKPDDAGGPVESSTMTGRPVYAGGPTVSIREARQSGRPCDKSTVIKWKPVHAGGPIVNNWEARQCGRPTRKIYVDVEAGLCRRPYCIQLGSPTMREAH